MIPPLQGKILRGFLATFFAFCSILLSAQESNDLAQNTQPATIVIDQSLGNNSAVLSMESEMQMYMQLKKYANQTFFHPVPSGGVLWLEHNLKGEVSLELMSSSNKVLLTAVGLQVRQLNLSGYPSGNYTLRISHQDGIKEQALIIK